MTTIIKQILIQYHGHFSATAHICMVIKPDIVSRLEQVLNEKKEPWLLATSLCSTSKTAKRVVKIYATRMQIE
jgi:hypothetical protein